jgi:chromosome segregation ATPase
MANEPDNLVLIQLREVRSELLGIRAKQAEHDGRFDQIDKRFEDFHALVSHTLTLGTATHLKSQELERRYEFGEGEQRRLRERVDDLERRLSEVEDKLDS